MLQIGYNGREKGRRRGNGDGEEKEIHTEREILKFLNKLTRMNLAFYAMKKRNNRFSWNE